MNVAKGITSFMSGFKKEIDIEYEKSEIERLLSLQKVNHILHLILSVLTAGIWLIVWLLVIISVSLERKRLENKLKELYKAMDKHKVLDVKSNDIKNAILVTEKDKQELKALMELMEIHVITPKEYEEKKKKILSKY